MLIIFIEYVTEKGINYVVTLSYMLIIFIEYVTEKGITYFVI